MSKWALWLPVLVFALDALAASGRVVVTGERVPLRAAADVNAEAVGTVAQGQVLRSYGQTDADWIQVEAPATASVYVYGTLVKDDAVAVNSIQVRSGPGVGYRTLGTLSQGTALDIQEQVGDWLRIAPPPGAVKAWVERRFVTAGTTPPAPAVTGPPAKPAPRVETASAPVERVPDTVSAPDVPPVARRAPPPQPVIVPAPIFAEGRAPDAVPVPASPVLQRPLTDRARVIDRKPVDAAVARLNLVANAPQGAYVVLRGKIRPAGPGWFQPGRYRLAARAARSETLCLLFGQSPAFEDTLGRTVVLSGRRYWVQGVRYPVVVPESLTLE